MPMAGRYQLPAISVDEAVEKLRRIRETCGKTATRETAAQAMGMSEKGGQTTYVLAALNDYGLTDTRGGEIRITDLGELAVFGNAAETLKAKSEAVDRIRLVGDIAKKYGLNPTEDQVRVFLRQDAGVELARVPALTDQVTRLFRKSTPYAVAEGAQQPGTAASQKISQEASASLAGSAQEETIEFRIGGSYVKLAMSDIDTAKIIINSILDKKMKELNEMPSSPSKSENGSSQHIMEGDRAAGG